MYGEWEETGLNVGTLERRETRGEIRIFTLKDVAPPVFVSVASKGLKARVGSGPDRIGAGQCTGEKWGRGKVES